ncbi:MAG: peptidoglycan-associated lipoprotein Pal [Elusimicrobiales bacterium]
MLSKILSMILTLFVLIATESCIKKQVKKEPQQASQQASQQQQTQDVITTTTTETDAEFGDSSENEEADVRKKISASLKTIYFDFDKYDLKTDAKDILSQNAKIIMENNLSIVIEGHCDERGTEQYNLSLGQKRANTVKDYYIRLGVNPSKIATISYGEEMPVCSEHTEECWALNRRAETKVSE